MRKMLFGLFPAMLACAASGSATSPTATASEVPPAAAATDVSGLDAAVRQASIENQYAEVLYRKHVDQARGYQKRLEYTRALDAVENALLVRPAGRDAIALEATLREQLGLRGGSVRTQMDDLYTSEQVRRQMEQIQVRKKLDLAAKASDRGEFDRAKELLEGALFIISTSRFQNDPFTKLRTTVREELEALEADAMQRSVEQNQRYLEDAFRNR